MTRENVTLDDIRNEAVPITPGTKDVWKGGRVGTIDMTREISKLGPGKYFSVANTYDPVIGFVENGMLYVVPGTNSRIAVLKHEGFEKAMFYIPFSSGDQPYNEPAKWVEKMEEAKQENVRSFGFFCSK